VKTMTSRAAAAFFACREPSKPGARCRKWQQGENND
jgi:hypothetical protein